MINKTRIAQSGVSAKLVGNGNGTPSSFAPRPGRTASTASLTAAEPTAQQVEEARVFASTFLPFGQTVTAVTELLDSGELEVSGLNHRDDTVTATFAADGTFARLTVTDVDGLTADKSDEIAAVFADMDVFRAPVAGKLKLDPRNPYGYTGVGRNTVDRMPKGKSEGRAALKNLRGEPDGGVRAVYLDYTTFPADSDVYGPKDGRPLLIVISSGKKALHIRSGNVIVHAGSSWGNSIHAHGDSKVTVICGEDRKVSTNAEDSAQITLIPGAGSRGFHSVSGPDAKTIIEDVGAEHGNDIFHDGVRVH